MSASTDVIVIGAGIIGMLTARELHQQGLSVAIFDQDAAGQAASWAGGGILSPLYPWRYDEAVTRLVSWSQQRYPELTAELQADTGIDPQWTRSGMLVLDQDEQAAARDWATRHDSSLETLTAQQLAALEPALPPGQTGALHLPGVAQVRNPRLLQALRATLEKPGIAVFEHEAIQHIEIHHRRAHGVRTARRTLQAARIIIAAGAWSQRLFPAIGDLPAIKPVKGQMLLYRGAPGMLGHIVLREGRYLIPRRDGGILAGSTLEDAGFDATPDRAACEDLSRSAAALLPALADCPLEAQWTGLRPFAGSEIPLIGPHPEIQGLLINSGHYRNGLVTAPASARLCADLARGVTPELPPTPYAPTARLGAKPTGTSATY